MSEFPEWLELRLGLGSVDANEARAIHKALLVLRAYVPNLDALLNQGLLGPRRAALLECLSIAEEIKQRYGAIPDVGLVLLIARLKQLLSHESA